jgi:hypothetical protein
MLQAHNEDSEDNSSISSEEGDAHFQYGCAAIASPNPNVAMALKPPKAWDLDLRSVWLLDSQSTFDLCCNPDFAAKMRKAKRALNMSSNGGRLRITKECMVLGYELWMWFTKRAMTNKICLKNIIVYIGLPMIASSGRHSLYIERNLVYQIWSLICIHVGCTSIILRRLMRSIVLFKLLLTI